MSAPERPIGRPRQYDNRVNGVMRLPADLHRRLHEAAEERDVSANLLVTRAIEEFLRRLVPLNEIQWTRDSSLGETVIEGDGSGSALPPFDPGSPGPHEAGWT